MSEFDPRAQAIGDLAEQVTALRSQLRAVEEERDKLHADFDEELRQLRALADDHEMCSMSSDAAYEKGRMVERDAAESRLHALREAAEHALSILERVHSTSNVFGAAQVLRVAVFNSKPAALAAPPEGEKA